MIGDHQHPEFPEIAIPRWRQHELVTESIRIVGSCNDVERERRSWVAEEAHGGRR